MVRSLMVATLFLLSIPGPLGALVIGRRDEDRRLRPKPVAPPALAEVQSAIRRGVAFLVKDQNRDGSWGTPQHTKDVNIYAPVPGAHQAFRTAVTALCVAALIEAQDESAPTVQALERGETWLLDNLPTLRRSSPETLYNVWGHIYGIQALVRMWRKAPHQESRRRRIETEIREQFDRLRRYESVDGGWGYYDFRLHTQRPAATPTSFMTASALIALYEAKSIGVIPPVRLVLRPERQLQDQRKPDFSYLYAEDERWIPMFIINRPGGSLGRSQACNLALRLWGDPSITDGVLKTWLDRLISRQLWLDLARKRPIPHESYFAVAGYFYYFGHYYAALCIEQLPSADRPFYQDHLAHILLSRQESDGSWWDYPLYNYHKQYGTAFALMALTRCRRATSPAASTTAEGG